MKSCTSSLLTTVALILALSLVVEGQRGEYYGSGWCLQQMRNYVYSNYQSPYDTNATRPEDCQYIRGYYWCVLPERFYYNPSDAELSRVRQNFQREFPELAYNNCNIDLRQVADMRFEMRQFDSYPTIVEEDMMVSAGADRFNSASMLSIVGTTLLTAVFLGQK